MGIFQTTLKGEFRRMGAAATVDGEAGTWEGPGLEEVACDGGTKAMKGRKSRGQNSGMAAHPCFDFPVGQKERFRAEGFWVLAVKRAFLKMDKLI